MLGGIGTWEILLIFLVALLLFGAKRIPEIARGLGRGITEFRKAVRDVKDEIETGIDSAPSSRPASGPDPSGPASTTGTKDQP